MNTIVGYIILILGIINALQMGFSFIAGDIYDIMHIKEIKKFKKKYYKPLVSIVISAFNEEQVIYRCLESIYKSDYKKFEVIVVNDGSRDKTSAEIVRFMQDYNTTNLKLVRQKNGGKASGLNNGIKNHAKGVLIMTLDADSIVSKDAISKSVAHFKDKKVIAVAATVRIINDGTVMGILQNIEYLLSYRIKKARTVINAEYIIGGVGSTFRKSVLKNCQYYDTNSLTEDIDLTLKIINKKGNMKNKIIYAADVICYTEGISTVKALFKQRYRWKYGFLQSLYKNRQLVLNNSTKYSKFLTFYNLPYAVYGEILCLIDPLLIAFVIFYSLRYTNISLFIGMFVFLTGYTVVAIASDEYSTRKEKFEMLLYAPISYLYFVALGLMGDFAFVKCLLNFKGIIHTHQAKKYTWDMTRKAVAVAG